MKRESRRYFRELAFYASLGFSVALSIVIGLAIGVYLDREVFQTTPWLTLIGLGLGIVAAYRNIGLAIKKVEIFEASARKRKNLRMDIQQRILSFVTRSNWILFVAASLAGLILAPPAFARGIFFGGLLVTLNFHLLARTLRKALTPSHLASPNAILAKYYIRFIASGFIIFILIAGRLVNPVGLVLGLSVVVASIILATLREAKNLIFKEAV